MDIETRILEILGEALELPPQRLVELGRDSALLGAIPELDSMGVVALITAFEDIFGFAVDDDEIDGSVFQTFGSLLDFVSAKLGG